MNDTGFKSSSRLGSDLSSAKGARLIDLLNEQRQTGHVDLNDRYIGDEGASVLANFLRNNPHIKTISIRGNKISSTGFSSICEALRHNTEISTLNAEWNDIGKDSKGLAALYEFVISSDFPGQELPHFEAHRPKEQRYQRT